MDIKKIARIHTDFPEKFGIPRQSGIVENLEGTIEFEPEFQNEDMIKGLEGFSHIWVIWGFSENKTWSPMVRPPRLGGNKKMGVFATRSPFRPNPIGLSVLKIESISLEEGKGPVINVLGIDMMDGTPIYDIKPYISYADSIPNAKDGFVGENIGTKLDVEFPKELITKIPEEKWESIIRVLSQDPRPSYQNDSERIYGMNFAGYNIKFKICEKKLQVIAVEYIKGRI